MTEETKTLIGSYLEQVRNWNALLSHQFGATNLLQEWRSGNIPKEGIITNGGGATYSLHGTGCSIESATGDLEFEFGPWGSVGGFDSWRLYLYAKSRPEWRLGNGLLETIEQALSDLEDSGYLAKIRLPPNPQLLMLSEEARKLRLRITNEGLA